MRLKGNEGTWRGSGMERWGGKAWEKETGIGRSQK